MVTKEDMDDGEKYRAWQTKKLIGEARRIVVKAYEDPEIFNTLLMNGILVFPLEPGIVLPEQGTKIRDGLMASVGVPENVGTQRLSRPMRWVTCESCKHTFKSRSTNPTCSNCKNKQCRLMTDGEISRIEIEPRTKGRNIYDE